MGSIFSGTADRKGTLFESIGWRSWFKKLIGVRSGAAINVFDCLTLIFGIDRFYLLESAPFESSRFFRLSSRKGANWRGKRDLELVLLFLRRLRYMRWLVPPPPPSTVNLPLLGVFFRSVVGC